MFEVGRETGCDTQPFKGRLSVFYMITLHTVELADEKF